MRINYGINRKKPNGKLEHSNHSCNIPGDWEDPAFHKVIRAHIQEQNPGWSITGYAIAGSELRQFDVWTEGYCCTGASSRATYHGSTSATSFQDACNYLFKINPHYDERHYDSERLTYWGCRLFSNEADARKSFG